MKRTATCYLTFIRGGVSVRPGETVEWEQQRDKTMMRIWVGGKTFDVHLIEFSMYFTENY